MKILRLDLSVFGPFTDVVLDLKAGREGLHVIYGPNEAGKSSALRALRQMLYGIDLRTPDNFLHAYPRLRVGGTLRRSDGSVLEFVRRKKQGKTLMTPDESEFIEDSRLWTFLNGVDKETFRNRFGINHDRLVRGGKEIVRGGGDMGQILFAGGLGIADFRKIQNSFLNQARDYFKPSGRNPRINQTLTAFKEKQKAMQEAQLPSQEWEQHHQAYNEAIQQKERAEAALAERLRERNYLERIREALPAIGRRKELLNELEAYADAVILPDDFSKKRQDALTHLRIGENEERQSADALEKIQKALGECRVPESLVANADFIENIYQDFGSVRKAMKDRLRLEGLKSSTEAEARDILRGLRGDMTLEQAEEQLRLDKAESVSIRELGAAYERLLAHSEGTDAEISKLSLRIDSLKKQLAETEAPRDTDELRKAAERARQHGDLEASYQSECRDIQKAAAAARVALRKLTLWTGELDALEKLPVPSPETIETFEQRLREAGEMVRERRTRIDELEQDLLKIEGEIEQLRIEQEVPTENDLIEARRDRDDNWHKILDAAFPLTPDVSEPYEQRVRNADGLADRLRREAERVAKKAALLSDRETRKIQTVRLKDQLNEADARFSAIREEWTSLWESLGISAKSPREMRAWARSQSRLADQASAVREQTARADELKKQIETHRREIVYSLSKLDDSQSFTFSDETLAHLLEISLQLIRRMDELRVKRDRICSELEQKEGELREATARAEKISQAISKWQSRWAKAVRTLGLDAGATPGQANAVIEDIKTLFVKLREADVFRKRIKGIDRDVREFSERVVRMAEQTAPDVSERPAEQIVAELNARLTRARTAKAEQQSLKKRAEDEERRLRSARKRISDIRAQFTVMCETAGCSTYEELPGAEERSARRQNVQIQLGQIETQLRKLSAGATLYEFVRDADQVDPDTISPMTDRLTDEIDRLNDEKSKLDQAIGSEENELRRMNGSSRAAELAEEAAGLLAGLETDVEQYVRLRLSSAVLNHAIERYREKNQEPILKRSEQLFAQMTLGFFEGLRLDFTEKGNAVLTGVRPGGGEMVSLGGMSDGTRDQLYLAIRLASLEAYMEKNEPMPFIVDDILIKFDDARAIATLQALAELSQKTQVIFFTHHHHLVGLAQKHIDGGVLFAHSLNYSPR